MAKDSSNDNDVPAALARPDAHGQAALLLVESLVHALIARAVLSVGEAIEIVDTAAEVEQEVKLELEVVSDTRTSSTLLKSISASLKLDLPQL